MVDLCTDVFGYIGLSFFAPLCTIIVIAIQVLVIIIPVLIAVAYLTLFERKVMAGMQLRWGPNIVGWYGLLQPFADGLKLLLKETIIPTGANQVVFLAAPMLTFILALVAWAVIPFDEGWGPNVGWNQVAASLDGSSHARLAKSKQDQDD